MAPELAMAQTARVARPSIRQARRQGKQQDQQAGTDTDMTGLPQSDDKRSKLSDIGSCEVQGAVFAHDQIPGRH